MSATPSATCDSLVFVDLPAAVTSGCQGRARELKDRTNEAVVTRFGTFFDVDPNDDPGRWELAGGEEIAKLLGSSVVDLRAGIRDMRCALRVRGLGQEYCPPPAPYDRASDFGDIPHVLLNVFGVIYYMGACSFSYDSENGGRIVRDVVAHHEAQEEYSSQGWGRELPWHMDGAFRPLTEDRLMFNLRLSPAPRWLVFGVLYDSPAVPMVFVPIDDVVEGLGKREVETLCGPSFDVCSPASFSPKTISRGVPILIRDGEGGYFTRFNQTACKGRTLSADRALRALAAALDATAIQYSIELKAGDVVVLDNWKSLHMRSAYTPRWDGTDRWMVRVYATPGKQSCVPSCIAHPRIWR